MTNTQKHTHLQTALANAQTKVCKSVCFSLTQEKMFLKNSHAQKNKTLQSHNHTLTSTLTTSTLTLSERVTGQGRRRASANKGYTTMRGAVLRMTVLCWAEHLCFVLKFSGNNPALRVAPERYRLF
jgi:hypothetical protein